MALVVDPSIPLPPDPTTIVSPDGRLTVVIDPTHAGALLKADFEPDAGDSEILQVNQVKNPRFGGGANLPLWWNTARSTNSVDPDKPRHAGGPPSLKVVTNLNESGVYAIQNASVGSRTSLPAGRDFTTLWSVFPESVSGSFNIWAYEYDAAGTLLTPILSSPAFSCPAGQWTDLRHTFTPKPETETIRLGIISPYNTIGQTFWVAEPMLTEAGFTGAYFDALSTPVGDITYRWAGAADASPSLQVTPKPGANIVVDPFFTDNATNSLRSVGGWTVSPAGATSASGNLNKLWLTTNGIGQAASGFLVTPGESVLMTSEVVNDIVGQDIRMRLSYYDISGTLLSTESSAATALPAGTSKLSYLFSVPANATWAAASVTGGTLGSGTITVRNPRIRRTPADSFGSGIDGWAAYQSGGGTLTLSNPTGQLAATWTAAATSAGVVWTLPTEIAGGQRCRLTFTITATGLVADELQVAFAPSAGASFEFVALPNPGSTTRVWTAEADIPAGSSLAKVFIYAHGSVAANGTITLEDVLVEPVAPDYVQFIRGTDQPVFGGDLATAVEGHAAAYDHQAPLGVSSRWQAFGTYADGTAGPYSEAVVATVPQPDYFQDVWIKSVLSPELSLRVGPNESPSVTREGRLFLQDRPASRNPVGSWDERSGIDTAITFTTSSFDEFDQVELLLNSGPLLIQTRPEYHLADFFCLPGKATWTYESIASDPHRVWTVQITEVDRPPTAEQPLLLPYRSIDSLEKDFTTIDAVDGAFRTLESMLEPM